MGELVRVAGKADVVPGAAMMGDDIKVEI